MQKLDSSVVNFFRNQGCVVVTTIDKNGFPHCACKGIVKIEESGRVYLLDAYRGKTFNNLKINKLASVTAFNEHKFNGFSLK